MDSRDHLADLLILLCGARRKAEVVTENVRDMLRWQRVLRRSGLRVTVVDARRA